jgi:hypothetical protein
MKTPLPNRDFLPDYDSNHDIEGISLTEKDELENADADLSIIYKDENLKTLSVSTLHSIIKKLKELVKYKDTIINKLRLRISVKNFDNTFLLTNNSPLKLYSNNSNATSAMQESTFNTNTNEKQLLLDYKNQLSKKSKKMNQLIQIIANQKAAINSLNVLLSLNKANQSKLVDLIDDNQNLSLQVNQLKLINTDIPLKIDNYTQTNSIFESTISNDNLKSLKKDSN